LKQSNFDRELGTLQHTLSMKLVNGAQLSSNFPEILRPIHNNKQQATNKKQQATNNNKHQTFE
jgi:hypothetical protein